MKILITGGAGFVGANLALYFANRGDEVWCLDNLARRGSEFNLPMLKENGIHFIHGDIRSAEDFPRIKPDVVLECSAQPSAIDGYGNPYYDFSNNTLGLINVLEYIRKDTEASLIFWSTNKVYSAEKINQFCTEETDTRWKWAVPTFPYPKGWNYCSGFDSTFPVDGGKHSIYGLSKIMSDLACQEYYDAFGIPIVVNRFSCLAGERQWGKSAQGWVAWWAIAAHFGLPLKYIGWKGKQVRDVLFIDDICGLIDAEISQMDTIKGNVFNVGGGHENTLSLIEATKLMEKKFNKKMVVTVEEDPRKADHCVYISNIEKAKRLIGWEPKVGIEAGYDKIIRWVKDNSDILKKLYL